VDVLRHLFPDGFLLRVVSLLNRSFHDRIELPRWSVYFGLNCPLLMLVTIYGWLCPG
jgi:hypothetical protein